MTFPNFICTVLFFDDGSSCCLKVAGRDFERHETKLYELELVDNSSNVYPVCLLGIDKIASNPGSSDVSIAYDTFPHVPEHALYVL